MYYYILLKLEVITHFVLSIITIFIIYNRLNILSLEIDSAILIQNSQVIRRMLGLLNY